MKHTFIIIGLVIFTTSAHSDNQDSSDSFSLPDTEELGDIWDTGVEAAKETWQDGKEDGADAWQEGKESGQGFWEGLKFESQKAWGEGTEILDDLFSDEETEKKSSDKRIDEI